MEESQTYPTTKNQEFGLLDVLVILAENLKLLIVVPLLVGLCVLGAANLLPQTYDSVALLQAERLDSQNAPVGISPTAVASLMTTASVMDPVAASLGLMAEGDIEEVRRKLLEQIKPAIGRNDKLLTLTVSASNPQLAQALAREVLRQTFIQSRPKGGDLARLEKQLAAARTRAENAQGAAANVAKRLETPGTVSNELAGSYAVLLSVTAAAQIQVSRLEAELEGLGNAQVVQEPTLPQRPSHPRKKLMAVGAALATGLLLVLFVFLRQALRSAAQDSEVGRKLARLRKAFGFK